MLPTARRAMLVMMLGAVTYGCGDGPSGPVPVATVVVKPDPVTVGVGETMQLSAVAQDQAGNPLSDRNITWASLNSTIASVTGGVVQGVSEGTTDVSAVVDGKTGTVAVTVTPALVASVEVRPLGAEVLFGETLQLTATPLDQGGSPLSGRMVDWSTSDTAIATVSAGGLVSGLTAGEVTITATVDQRDGRTDVAVLDPTAPRISIITPFPMVEGGSATLSGVNLGATAGENTVTVDGVAAVVTGVDATSVTFTVPPTGCRPHRDVSVRVTAGGKSGSRSHPLRPTFTQVEVGEQVILSGPGAPCLQFDATQAFESYLVGVQSTSSNVSDLDPIQIAAKTGLTAGGPTSTAIAAAAEPAAWRAYPAAQAPASGASPAGGSNLDPRSLRVLRDRALWHVSARYEEGQRLALDAPDFSAAASGTLQSVIPTNASVGQRFTVRVPRHFPGGCTQFDAVTAEIRVITPRSYWLVDLANPLGGFSDAQLLQMATEFEDNVAPTLESMFGPIPDTDGNVRISFVVTSKVTDRWLAYASLFDYLPQSQCAASNEGDWLYVAAPDASRKGFSRLEMLEIMGHSLAHDFTHVIQNRAVIGGGARADAWIEEGQAELGAEVYGHAVTMRSPRQNYGSGVIFSLIGTAGPYRPYRMVADLEVYFGSQKEADPKVVGAPEQCSWVAPVVNGNPVGPCDPEAASSGSWAFLRWLTDHYAAVVGGDEAFHQALIDATGSGFDRIATLTGVPIETLLARFGAALYVDDRIDLAEVTLEFPSWDLADMAQSPFQQEQLTPRSLGFTAFSETASVRAASTAYFIISAPGRPATAIEVTGPLGGPLSPDVQVWAVRLQ